MSFDITFNFSVIFAVQLNLSQGAICKWAFFSRKEMVDWAAMITDKQYLHF